MKVSHIRYQPVKGFAQHVRNHQTTNEASKGFVKIRKNLYMTYFIAHSFVTCPLNLQRMDETTIGFI